MWNRNKNKCLCEYLSTYYTHYIFHGVYLTSIKIKKSVLPNKRVEVNCTWLGILHEIVNILISLLTWVFTYSMFQLKGIISS